jgi:hypothetical protein
MDHAVVSTESCAQCGAPLADDQRYCLQCGEPRPHVSGPLSAKPATDRASQAAPPLGASPSSPPGVPPPLPGAGTVSSTRNNSLALLAGVGVLLLAMGIGVLIGRAGAGSAKAPPVQVISLGSATGASTAASAPPTTEAKPSTSTSSAKKGARAKASSGAGSSLAKPAPASSVQNLRSGGSGESYEQKSKNLPDVVETG